MIDPNNPSYYRSHQYRNQFDLPNSALKNRDLQSFPSSIPQGKQYFQQSNKKHFAHKFNRSQIQQDNVLHQYPEQQVKNSRIVFDSSYFRSLNVDDIEGTRPNTLISKAIKNRQKAVNLMKKQEEPRSWQNKPVIGNQSYLIGSHQIEPHFINEVYLQNKPDKNKQSQAVNKFKKSKSILQNSSANVLGHFIPQNNSYQPVVHLSNINVKNEQKDKINNKSSNFHYRGLSKAINSNKFDNLQTLQSDEEQMIQKVVNKSKLKQQRVYEIQNQLLSNLQLKNNNHQNQELSKKSKTQRNEPYLNYQTTHINKYQRPQKQNNTIDNNFQNYQYNQKNHQQYNVKSRILTNQSYQDSLSPNILHKHHYQPQKNYHTSTETENSNLFINYNITPKINKSNIRKFNPTFLSFQSQTIGRHKKSQHQ